MNTTNSTLLASTNTLTGGFQSYLNYAYSLPILSEKEEHELFTQFKNNNDLKAAKKIVLSHIRFVAFIAKNYVAYGLLLEDLVQEGTIGLMKSVKRFDLSYGVRLASFAIHWIKAEIHDYVIKNWKLVKVATTKAHRKLFFNLRKHKKNNCWMSNQETKEVATYLDVDESDVKEMEKRLYQQDCYLGTTDKENENSFSIGNNKLIEHHSVNPERELIQSDYKNKTLQKVHAFLAGCDERTKDIIEKRWLRDGADRVTLKELSNKYQVSQERIRQIEEAALNKMNKELNSCY